MFSNSNCASVPLVANVGGNSENGAWGDGGWLWIIVVFALLFGWGGNGFGGNGWGGNGMNGGVGSEVQRGFDTQTIVGKLDRLGDGICSLGYDQLSQMNGINQNISNGFHGMENAICTLGYQTQNGFNTTNVALMQAQNALQTQLANCCCENREGQAQIRYDMATQACDTRQTVQNSARDIIDNANANNRAILDFLVNDKIATLTAENQSLKFAASQTAQNQFITQVGSDIVNRLQPVPVPAFPASNLYAYGNGSGCGCNSCC